MECFGGKSKRRQTSKSVKKRNTTRMAKKGVWFLWLKKEKITGAGNAVTYTVRESQWKSVKNGARNTNPVI